MSHRESTWTSYASWFNSYRHKIPWNENFECFCPCVLFDGLSCLFGIRAADLVLGLLLRTDIIMLGEFILNWTIWKYRLSMNLNIERKYRSSAGVSLDHSLSLLDTKSEIGFDEIIIQIGNLRSSWIYVQLLRSLLMGRTAFLRSNTLFDWTSISFAE